MPRKVGEIEEEFESHQLAILDILDTIKPRKTAYELLSHLYGGKPRGWRKFFERHPEHLRRPPAKLRELLKLTKSS